MDFDLLPFLSEFDPPQQTEGTIDPLGMYAIADALGTKLAPGVRERQSHPRYLTLAAVGSVVCDGLDPDREPPPWLVLEWYAVEGLVRCQGVAGDIQGLPGRNKVSDAIRRAEAVCASTYLKTPTVFGFHGIYRILGEEAEVFADGALLERGSELVEAWEQDQGLVGFRANAGEMASIRRSLAQAVRDGQDAGRTARSSNWAGWEFFARHLTPRRCGQRERALLWRFICGEPGSLRHELCRFAVSEEGQRTWQGAEGSERAFHQVLLPRASESMQTLLRAVVAYESLARRLQDGFDDCLHALSSARNPLSPRGLARAANVQRAAKEVPALYEEACSRLGGVEPQLALRLETAFGGFSMPVDPVAWVELLLAHHERIQSRKPPNGKAPWILRFDDGRFAVRPAYRRDQPGRGDDLYVHGYRTNPVWSFATDVEQVPS